MEGVTSLGHRLTHLPSSCLGVRSTGSAHCFLMYYLALFSSSSLLSGFTVHDMVEGQGRVQSQVSSVPPIREFTILQFC